jgi:hypothetical protein
LTFILRSNIGQKPKNIAKSLKIFFCRTIFAGDELKTVSQSLRGSFSSLFETSTCDQFLGQNEISF